MGYTMTQWDALSDYDRSWLLALHLHEAALEADRCSQCGGPKSECQDTDNQHAYEVEFRRCYRTQRVLEVGGKREDHAGVVSIARLNPAKKKSARKV